MTNTLAFKQSGHLNPELSSPAGKMLKADNLIGHWLNTNRQTQGIAECRVAAWETRWQLAARRERAAAGRHRQAGGGGREIPFAQAAPARFGDGVFGADGAPVAGLGVNPGTEV